MPTTAEKITSLQALNAAGTKIQVAQVVSVAFPAPDGTKYYANVRTDKLSPFRAIPVSGVEPRLLTQGFIPYKISPDLTDEDISLNFSEVLDGTNDLEIQRLYTTHGAGVRVELYYYFPQVDLWISRWFGQLSAPDSSTYQTFNTKATNGFISRLMISPHRSFYSACSSPFGGTFSTQAEIDLIACPYNRQISGGTVGNLNSGSPYTSCPKDEAGCTARLGNKSFFYGYSITASPTIANKQGQLAVSRGNISNLRRPLRRVYGYKTIRDLDLLLWKREPNISNPDKGFVAAIWAVHDGRAETIYDFKVNDGSINVQAIQYRTGEFGQPPTSYAPDVSNFSGVTHIFARLGWVNANQIDATQLKTQITLKAQPVRVYTDETTYGIQSVNNRVWCLMDVYADRNVMNGVDYDRFDITSWGGVANWCGTTVSFTDLKGVTRTHIRTQFDCDMQGRSTDEQIKDICACGRFTVPYQEDGKLKLRAFKAEDVSGAKVFTDTGKNRNIEVIDGIPQIFPSQKDFKDLPNVVTLTFEDSANGDIERPITAEDETAQFIAGLAFGDTTRREVPFRREAYGIRYESEAVKLAHALLFLGEFDEGGTKNNLRVSFETWFVNVLDVKRYDVIKIDSAILTNFLGATKLGLEDFNEPYFRVLDMQMKDNGKVTVTAQAYPKDFYDNFETEILPGDPLPPDVGVGDPLNTGIWDVPFTNYPKSPSSITPIFDGGYLKIEVLNT